MVPLIFILLAVCKGVLIEYGLANQIANVTARSDLEVKAGDNLKIVCNEIRIENRRIVWFIKVDGDLQRTICSKRPTEESCDISISYPRYYNSIVINDTSVLVLTVRGNESGDYGCEVTMGQDIFKKIYGNITVVEKPPEPLLASVEVLKSTQANLTCTLTTTPNGNLTYWWQKKEGETQIDLGSRDNFPVYRIHDAHPDKDTGQYRCKAGNIAGLSNWSYWASVDVIYAPDLGALIDAHKNNSLVNTYADYDLDLTCRVTGGHPLANLTWSCPAGLTATQDQDTKDRVTTSVLTGKVNKDMNSATCLCVAVWRGTQHLWPAIVNLNVYYPPDQPILRPDPKMPWLENSSYTMECVVEDRGNGPCSYRWYRNGTQVLGQTSYRLPLTVTKDDNNSDVRCTLDNKYIQEKGGSYSSSTKLNVEYLPRVSIQSKATEKENRTVTMNCSADSNPPADPDSHFRWTLGASHVQKGTKAQLVLQSLTKADSGQYTCSVTLPSSGDNGNLMGNSSTSLTVQYLHIISTSNSTEVTEGETLSITCTAEGVPDQWKFSRWSHTGRYHTGTRLVGEETSEGTSTYTVSSVNYTYMGEYMCRVSNEVDDQQRRVPVAVRFPPKNKTHREEGEKIFTEFGHDKTMEITVFAYPEDVVFTWFIQSVNNSNFTRIKESDERFHIATSGLMSTLTVFNITIGELTNYTVHANNSVLQGSSFKFELAARGCPTPASVDVIRPTAVSLTISWRPGFNGGFSQTVYVNLCNASTDLCETKDTLENPEYDTPVSTLVLGLQDNTRYKIKIESHNEYDVHNDGTGCTVTTEAGTHRTKEKPVVGGEKFTVLYKDNRAELSWDLPSSPGSYTHQEVEQKEMTIRRRRQVDRCQPPSCHVVPKGETNLTVPVEPGKKYTFTLVLYDGDIPVYSVAATEDKAPANTPGPQSSVGAIAGGVAGGLLAIIVIVIVVIVFLWRKQILGKGGSDGVNRWLMRKSKDQNGGTTNPAFSDTEAHGNSEGAGPYSEVGSSQTSLAHAGPVDDGTQLYAQPDKGKKNKKKQQGAAGGAAAAPELYAEVNKKGKKAAQAEGPVLYAEVNKKGKAPTGDVYAEVKKGKKKDEQPEVYAEVNKKGGKKDKKDKKKGKKGKDEPEPTLYENIPKNIKGQKKKAVGPTGTEYEDVRGAYANMSRGAAGGLPEDEGAYSEVQARLNPDTEITSPPPGSDGLTYMELEIIKKPRDSAPKPVIAPKPDATVYADIDLTRRVDPLPPDPPPSGDNKDKGQGQ